MFIAVPHCFFNEYISTQKLKWYVYVYRSTHIASSWYNVTRVNEHPLIYLHNIYLRICTKDFCLVCVLVCIFVYFICAICNVVYILCDSPPAASFICISVSMSTVCIGFGGNFVGRTSSSRDWLVKCWRISIGDCVVVDVVVTNVSGGRRRTESPAPHGLPPSINKTKAAERHALTYDSLCIEHDDDMGVCE